MLSWLKNMNFLKGNRKPALILFFLSPAIAELLSGSAPPAEFFNPFGFLLIVFLYGSGCLIMRELVVRWKKSICSLILLGAAYGVIEEGIMVKSFFDPKWPDLGILGQFGRWLGINWIWAEMLTIYHAIFSVAIPVLLVELAFPTRKNDPWTSKKTFNCLLIILGAVVLFGFLFLTPYRPPPAQYFSSIALTAALIYIAKNMPEDCGRRGVQELKRPAFYFVIGLAWSVAFFLTFMALPQVVKDPFSVALLGALLSFGVASYLMRFDWRDSNQQKLSLAAGALSFLIFLAFLQEMDKNRPDNTTGMSLVAIAAILGLILLKRRVEKAFMKNKGEEVLGLDLD